MGSVRRIWSSSNRLSWMPRYSPFSGLYEFEMHSPFLLTSIVSLRLNINALATPASGLQLRGLALSGKGRFCGIAPFLGLMADHWPSQIWWIGRLSYYAICLDLLEMN